MTSDVRRVHRVRARRLHRDAGEVAVAGEGVLHGGQRGDDPVVLVLRPGAALRGRAARPPAYSIPLNCTVCPTIAVPSPPTRLVATVMPDQRDPAALVVVGLSVNGAPVGDRVVVVHQVARRRAGEGADRVRGARRTVGRHRRRVDHRRDGDDVGRLRRVLQRLRVVEGQRGRAGLGAVVDRADAAAAPPPPARAPPPAPRAARPRRPPPGPRTRAARPRHRLPRRRRPQPASDRTRTPPAPPPPTRRPAAVEVDVTVRVLLPSALIEFWTAALAPVPAATRMITAATPMRMPDIVSTERSLFAATPRAANRTLSRTFTGPPPPSRRRRIGRRRDPPRRPRCARPASAPPAWRGAPPPPRG